MIRSESKMASQLFLQKSLKTLQHTSQFFRKAALNSAISGHNDPKTAREILKGLNEGLLLRLIRCVQF